MRRCVFADDAVDLSGYIDEFILTLYELATEVEYEIYISRNPYDLPDGMWKVVAVDICNDKREKYMVEPFSFRSYDDANAAATWIIEDAKNRTRESVMPNVLYVSHLNY